MVGRLFHRTFDLSESISNLDELRLRLVRYILLLALALSAFAVWIALPRQPFPFAASAFWMTVFALSALTLWVERRSPSASKYLFVCGGVGVVLLATYLFAARWVPFTGLLILFSAAVVLPRAQIAGAAAMVLEALWLDSYYGRDYPLPSIVLVLVFGLGIAWLVMHTLYTALAWAWNMQKRGDKLLEAVRKHRAELVQALRSLEQTNRALARAHNELLIARQQADEARRLKEQFAANISHELRTPLNLILGFSEVIYLSPEVYGEMNWPPTLRRDVYQVYRSSRHLLEMIDDILDLSKFEMTGFTLRKEISPIAPLIREAVEITNDLFRARSVKVEVDIEEGLPPLDIDRTRIRQVLINLLKNAQSFVEVSEVKLKAERRDGEVQISVQDNGPGIPPEKLPYIFEEFYQVDHARKRSYEGAGLGLTISERFVHEHKGRLWATSEPERGTTFCFTLPVPGEFSTMAYAAGARDVQADRSAPRPCVLMVENDRTVAAQVQRLNEGYDIALAGNLSDLRRLVATCSPRGIIVNTRYEDSEAVRRELREPLPIIECSLESSTLALSERKVDGVLTKPVSAQDLVREIERIERARGPIESVLIVDDDRGFCQLVERVLGIARPHYLLLKAYDPIEGIEAAISQMPDLILLDLVMPELDGLTALNRIRRHDGLADIPVLVLTATSLTDETTASETNKVTVQQKGGLSQIDELRYVSALLGALRPLRGGEDSPT